MHNIIRIFRSIVTLAPPNFVLFGLRSPLVVDFEVTAERAGRILVHGVSVSGHPRIFGNMNIVDLKNLDTATPFPVIPCAFSPTRRAELVQLATDAGYTLAEALIDPTAILPPRMQIGDGSFINAGVVVGGGASFGSCVFVNRSASIGHHTVLEDYVTIGPGAILSGNVRVGRNTVIGAGAIIQSNVRIGEGALVSAGSVVRRHVSDGALIAGNPGKVMPFRPAHSSLDLVGGE